MENRHREILRKARAKLVRDLNVADILNRFPEPIFTELDEEEIKAERRNRHKQNEILLDILPRRGPRAYYAFKEALKRPYLFLFEVLEQEEELDRERISTAKTMRELRAELQEKTEENKKLFEESKELRRQLEQMARIREDLNQERRNSEQLALERQDLKAKLEKEKEESKKIVDERDQLRKQLEEKGSTRKTTQDENERRKTRAQEEKLQAIRRILGDDRNELPETRRMDEQQGIAAGENYKNQQQISPLCTAELDNEDKVSKPSVKEIVKEIDQNVKSMKSLFEKVCPNHKFEATVKGHKRRKSRQTRHLEDFKNLGSRSSKNHPRKLDPLVR